MSEYLILVDENDIECGKMEKHLVHLLGYLHRAFSVFIFNNKGELLLQQRADEKYHSGGLWTNTCCSHPQFGETLQYAVSRRLKEEMGLSCDASFAFSFMYKSNFVNGLVENEFDHVFIGTSDSVPEPNKSEVKSWKYMNVDKLALDIQQNPNVYTVWFKICFTKVLEQYSVVTNRKYECTSI